MEDYEKPLTEDEEALQDTDDDSLETIDESELADDEYIEEEADVEDVANSNKALLNALKSITALSISMSSFAAINFCV